MGYIIKLSLSNIKLRKLRTVLTIVGIMIGVMSIVAMLTTGLNAKKAMLEDEGSSRTADLELRLNKNSGYISRYRTRLIEHGVIEPVSRGYVRMAIPGLREYLETVARG